MSEKNTTHVQWKHPHSKKQMQKEKIQEHIIYSEVNESTSNSNQTKITRTKSSKRKVSSIPFTWRQGVVILGIFCVFLLSTTGILGLMVLQGHQECQRQKLPLDNITEKDNSTFENIIFIKDLFNTGSENSTCKSRWSCCGDKCYYFSDEMKTFDESKESCKKMNSVLPKIDDKKELEFIQSQISYFSWIGLSRQGTRGFWKWEDNSQPTVEMNWQESKIGNCARISAKRITASDCSIKSHYVCEK